MVWNWYSLLFIDYFSKLKIFLLLSPERFYTEACLFILYFTLCSSALILNRTFYYNLVHDDVLHQTSGTTSLTTTSSHFLHETTTTNSLLSSMTSNSIATSTTAVSTNTTVHTDTTTHFALI